MTISAQNALHARNILGNAKLGHNASSYVRQEEYFGAPATRLDYDKLNLPKINWRTIADTLQCGTYIVHKDVRNEHIPSSSAITTFIHENLERCVQRTPSFAHHYVVYTAALGLLNQLQDVEQSSHHESVFDELLILRTDDSRFRAVLSELRSLDEVQAKSAIADRLETLLGDFQDDYDRCLSTESLQSFVALLKANPQLSKPLITAATSGNLVLEWESKDKKQYLALHLLPTSQIQYTAYCPSSVNPQIRKYSSGTSTVDELFSDLSAYKILEWAILNER